MLRTAAVVRAAWMWLLLLSSDGLASAQEVMRSSLVPPPDAVARIDELFERWETTESPGCAVGVGLNAAAVVARAYGMADLEQERPNCADTVFEVGSVSKQFTAAAVLLLAQQGKLSLEDPVRKYIPELPDYGQPITIRQMMTHTSGLRDWGSVVAASGWPRTSRVHTHAHVLDVVSRQKALNFSPGDEHSYSNSGYNLMAILVSRVSGESFAQFSKKYIFEPLGMTHTEWRDDYTRVVKRRATAYSPNREKGWRMNMPFENVHGNGGLLTTVEDMLKWNENFVHARVGGSQFVDMQLRRGRLSDGKEIEYAAGLYVSAWRGVKETRHSGSTAGYRAFLARYPDYGLSVAVACNASNANASRLAHQVAELYLGAELSPETKPPPAITLHVEALEHRAGVYRNARTGAALRVILDGGKLRLEDGPELKPLSATSFRIGDRNSWFEFDLDAGGTVVAMRRVSPSGDSQRYTRERAATPDAGALSAYAGRYRSEEAEAEFVASVEEDQLVLRRRPDAVFKLKPAWDDAFIAPFGTVVFRRGTGGRIEGMSLVVSRMYDLRFTRVDLRTPGKQPRDQP